MSKKKNTLKDLDEFLKQQATSFVTPQKLTVKQEVAEEKIAEQKTEEVSVKIPQESIAASQEPETPQATELTFREVFSQLQELYKKNEPAEFRRKFIDLILATVEAQAHQLPEDKILINTMLYLKHGERWKDGIKEYWQNHE